jgi:hypothetical protein
VGPGYSRPTASRAGPGQRGRRGAHHDGGATAGYPALTRMAARAPPHQPPPAAGYIRAGYSGRLHPGRRRHVHCARGGCTRPARRARAPPPSARPRRSVRGGPRRGGPFRPAGRRRCDKICGGGGGSGGGGGGGGGGGRIRVGEVRRSGAGQPGPSTTKAATTVMSSCVCVRERERERERERDR